MAWVPLTTAAAMALTKLRQAGDEGCHIDEFDADEFQALKQLRVTGMVKVYPPASPHRLFITADGIDAIRDADA